MGYGVVGGGGAGGRIFEGYEIRCIVNVGTSRREVSVVLL